MKGNKFQSKLWQWNHELYFIHIWLILMMLKVPNSHLSGWWDWDTETFGNLTWIPAIEQSCDSQLSSMERWSSRAVDLSWFESFEFRNNFLWEKVTIVNSEKKKKKEFSRFNNCRTQRSKMFLSKCHNKIHFSLS